jgi:hypothetical protein
VQTPTRRRLTPADTALKSSITRCQEYRTALEARLAAIKGEMDAWAMHSPDAFTVSALAGALIAAAANMDGERLKRHAEVLRRDRGVAT